MSRGALPRRAMLLGAAALLPGCGTLDDLFGERKRPLPGERVNILRSDSELTTDTDAAAVTLPPPEQVVDWPMNGGPVSHAPGHVALGERLSVAWRASAGSGSGYRQRMTSGPVIVDGVVYAVDAWGSVFACTLADGRTRWNRDSTPEDESAGPVAGGVGVADGVVYVSTGLAEILAINAADGSVRWRERLPAPARGAPTIAGGRIFVTTLDNQLVALSTEDGRRIWAHRGQSLSTMPLGLGAPAVEGDTVVAGFGTGEVVAARVSDGRVQWGESVGSTALMSLADFIGITALPVIDRGRVFIVGQSNTTIAVDLRSGRRLWERPFGGGNHVATAGDYAFAATRSGEVVAVGREDGRIAWVTELDPPPAQGSRRGPPIRLGPALVGGGRIIVPTSRAELVLLNPGNGSIAGRVPTGSGITLPMAVSQGTLVALGDDGTLIALR